jgi:hypothetical protein
MPEGNKLLGRLGIEEKLILYLKVGVKETV